MIIPRMDLAAREINPSVNHSIDASLENFSSSNVFDAEIHHSILARMTCRRIRVCRKKVAFEQSEVDMAVLACALERYRLARGQYPEELNALIPRFVAVFAARHHQWAAVAISAYRRWKIHHLFHRLERKRTTAAWSLRPKTSRRQDVLQGDWVLQYPEGK